MIHTQSTIPQPTRFIDPAALTRISSLELVARTVVEGFISGLHRSPHLGFSVNFAEYRHYHPGDDIRRVDWKVFGRTDRYYIKEYEGDTNTAVNLILDCSRSMAYGSRGITKFEYGQYLSACLAYFAFKQRDSVGFAAYDNQVREQVPARGSIGHLNTVLHAIERLTPKERTSFSRPLVEVAERLRRRGIVVLVSDLYDDPEEVIMGIRNLAFRGNDVIVFHLLDAAELQFGFEKSAQFVDLETREEMHVIPGFLRREYLKLIRDQIASFEMECRKDRIDYMLMDTSQPLDHALFTYLARRAQMY